MFSLDFFFKERVYRKRYKAHNFQGNFQSRVMRISWNIHDILQNNNNNNIDSS